MQAVRILLECFFLQFIHRYYFLLGMGATSTEVVELRTDLTHLTDNQRSAFKAVRDSIRMNIFHIYQLTKYC